MEFTKMHGNGNDFIVIDDFDSRLENEEEIAKVLCDRHFGIGSDGILIARKSHNADIKMVIINSDGSTASMCGNGIRCFAKYLWDKKYVSKAKISIETGDGIKEAIINLEDSLFKSVTIDMGEPKFNPEEIPANSKNEIINKAVTVDGRNYLINSLLMGVPHTVIIGELDSFKTEEGRFIEKHDIFPRGTNVNFCEVVSRNFIKVKTWERGAGATLACGTGSCACVVLCNRLGYTDNKVFVEIPGGHLEIHIKDGRVFMTGPAVTTFIGECDINEIN